MRTLALYLLVWRPQRLAGGERFVLGAVIAFAGASHMAIFAVLAGLSVIVGAVWLARRQLHLAPRIGCAVIAVWSGLVLQVAGNFIVTGHITIQADGEIFLFARMIEDDMVSDLLSGECPRANWKLCQHRDALPPYAEAFLFFPDSLLQKIGGPFEPKARHEIATIVAHALMRHPMAHASRAVELTATQFVGVGGAMEPSESGYTRAALIRYAPTLVPSFDAARQQTDNIDVSDWSDWVVVPISLVASFALPFCAVLVWRRGQRREAMLPVLVFIALVGNAAVCGVMAGSNDRYQARLVWLAPLAVGLTGRALTLAGKPYCDACRSKSAAEVQGPIRERRHKGSR
jgi:hypothetical protein